MGNFKLHREGQDSFTGVPNNFIENYMPQAAGEFVKIYIYLLKCISENCGELSVSRISDVFNNTEKDTIRALKYWDRKGLLRLTFAEDGSVESLVVTDAPNMRETFITRADAEGDPLKKGSDMQDMDDADVRMQAASMIPDAKQYSRGELEEFSRSESNETLIFVVQKLIGRTMTPADINSIMFMQDKLGFSQELIEYLFEYCAEKKKTSIRYIEKTAIAWAEKGIENVEGAKLLNANFSGNYYPVMRAFGLTGRNPAKEECRYMDKWTLSYGFGTDMIVEAADRTIKATHKPSFEYADSILKRWRADGVKDLDEVRAADERFASKKSSKDNTSSDKIHKSVSARTQFNSFEQRDYDFDDIEDKLVNN